MLLRIATSALGLFLLSVQVSSAQDLNQLPARVTKFWELRKQGDRLGALDFVEPGSKQNYLKWQESPFISYKVIGLEFTDDPNRLNVPVSVRFLLPEIGEINRITRDAWVWRNGQWFLLASNESMGAVYAADEKTTAPSRTPPAFTVAD